MKNIIKGFKKQNGVVNIANVPLAAFFTIIMSLGLSLFNLTNELPDYSVNMSVVVFMGFLGLLQIVEWRELGKSDYSSMEEYLKNE